MRTKIAYIISMMLETNNPLTVTATVAFIEEAHSGQKYGNMPYFFHPVEVAQEAVCLVEYAASNDGSGSYLQDFAAPARLVALLHDVVEDTKYTESDLRERYESAIVDAVMLLTLKESNDYRENIQRIVDSGNTLAMMVKLADNHVNRRGDKSSFSAEKAKKLNDRYDMSIEMLTKALAEWGIRV